MAQIQQKGKSHNKRFQFYAPSELLDELAEKKEKLERHNLVVDMTDDFVKVIKDAIKTIDKRLDDLSGDKASNANS
ncbi:hypothetical protein EXT65_21595 [Pectobacterium carotovorum subsp. carotovorum]|nr:hypothetical protein [Pectobacterium carotovorum]MCL6336391.1 hypothetical protein [Pectobacterium carotovorum subsp. carotovorum]